MGDARAADYRRIVSEYGYVEEYAASTQRELDALALARQVAEANPDQLVRTGHEAWVTRYAEEAVDSSGVVSIPLYYFYGYLHRVVPRGKTERISVSKFNDLAFDAVMDPQFRDRWNNLKWLEAHPNTPQRHAKLQCPHCKHDIFPTEAENCSACGAAKCDLGHCLCGTVWDGTYRRAQYRDLFTD
ncbi:hypothetical protein ACFOHU_12555 [Ottowia pentelensis]|uniref:hypothetical protein n=1 Tax=Ottowia pentelensis TaxID=511108 RepID=UPI0036187097